MPEFHLTWEIDVHADDPVDAARKAFSLVRIPDSSANVFDVLQHDDTKGSVRIDLEEHGIDRESDMPRNLLSVLKKLTEQVKATSAYEDAECGEDPDLWCAVTDAEIWINRAEGRDGGA